MEAFFHNTPSTSSSPDFFEFPQEDNKSIIEPTNWQTNEKKWNLGGVEAA